MNPAAGQALKKLGAVVAFTTLLGVVIGSTNNETLIAVSLLVLIFLALPVLILACIDAGHIVRAAPDVPAPIRVLGILLSIPQAIFGLVSVVIGLAIILWVAYNLLVERQPEFTGGFIPSLGIGPLLVFAGYWWIRSAFRKDAGDDGT